MPLSLLEQAPRGLLPPIVIAGLILVAIVSALALFVCLRIARRIREIGDRPERAIAQPPTGEHMTSDDVSPPSTTQ